MMNKYTIKVITTEKETYIFSTEAKNNIEAIKKVDVCMKIERPTKQIKEISIV